MVPPSLSPPAPLCLWSLPSPLSSHVLYLILSHLSRLLCLPHCACLTPHPTVCLHRLGGMSGTTVHLGKDQRPGPSLLKFLSPVPLPPKHPSSLSPPVLSAMQPRLVRPPGPHPASCDGLSHGTQVRASTKTSPCHSPLAPPWPGIQSRVFPKTSSAPSQPQAFLLLTPA